MSSVPAEPGRPLREIKGPSALGGNARRFWNLVWLIASTEFKLTYFGSALGYLWSLVRPLLFFGVLYVVFAVIVKFGGGVPDYPVVLLLNIVLFSFFQEATGAAITAVVARESLVRKMHFPRLVIPLATVLTAAMNLVVNLLAVIVFLLAYGIRPRLTWLLLPVIVVAFVVLACGVAMILSSLYVRYRDVAPIWTVVSQALFYGSPIFYVVTTVPESARFAYMCNPFAPLLEQARKWLIDPTAPGAATVIGGGLRLFIPIGIGIAIVAYGFYVFDREAPRIAEEL